MKTLGKGKTKNLLTPAVPGSILWVFTALAVNVTSVEKRGRRKVFQPVFLGDYARDQRRRGLLESTITKRLQAVRLFGLWMGDRPVLKATAGDIQTFLDTRRLGKRGRYTWISHLHTFFEWAVSQGLSGQDPTVEIPRPRLPKRLPRPISSEDLTLLLRVAPHKMRLTLLLASLQGMRCGEIAGLCRSDILDSREPYSLVVHGKGEKERIIPLHPDVWEALQALPLPKAGHVFRQEDGQPYPPWKMSQVANEFIAWNGVDATMHQLRHWFATQVYQTSGHDLLLVADLMGHASTATTAIYAQFDKTRATSAISSLQVTGE